MTQPVGIHLPNAVAPHSKVYCLAPHLTTLRNLPEDHYIDADPEKTSHHLLSTVLYQSRQELPELLEQWFAAFFASHTTITNITVTFAVR
jgi:hypothetical protein